MAVTLPCRILSVGMIVPPRIVLVVPQQAASRAMAVPAGERPIGIATRSGAGSLVTDARDGSPLAASGVRPVPFDQRPFRTADLCRRTRTIAAAAPTQTAATTTTRYTKTSGVTTTVTTAAGPLLPNFIARGNCTSHANSSAAAETATRATSTAAAVANGTGAATASGIGAEPTAAVRIAAGGAGAVLVVPRVTSAAHANHVLVSPVHVPRVVRR